MATLYNDGDTLWIKHFLKGMGYLLREPFLYLQSAREHLRDPGELGQPDDSAIRNVPNVYLFVR